MKLLKQSFEIIEQGYSKEDILKHIEKCARVCYKSEDKITDDSHIKFCEMLKNRGHLSTYEHGTVYIHFNYYTGGLTRENNVYKYVDNPYSKVEMSRETTDSYIATNLRVIQENGWEKDLEFLCSPTEHHHKRVTVKILTNRAIANEFVRHRKFSFSQESTRYVNYSLDKFSNDIGFIIPSNMNIPEGVYRLWDGDWVDPESLKILVEGKPFNKEDEFLNSVYEAEMFYKKLIQDGCKAQEARDVLPLCTKTELVMTGFVSDWKHFFELRCSPAAHPQANELATSIKKEFINRGLVNL